MRKQQKKQAEEFVKLLSQAHDEIRESIEHRRNDVAINFLVQCQEGAVQLGELIEKTEGEQCATIALLEQYCELTYQIHEDICNGTEININNIFKKLRKALIHIENSIKYDIKVKLEIVFLPYKASMWDSLESVWMAADEDPDCDAYVIPIPYYDRNTDGTFGKYHYEAGDMPEYVPITHYDSYNFEERRPDVIYIHNPYDQGNYVTSVDPRYYSYVLKKYTDCLVYIPYYTISGSMAEGQAMCSAYRYVDYIVIQTEKFRKFFDNSIPDEKFLPLGSPKFDRVIRLCNNPPEPPEEWKEKMRGKKVYFYNTSIGGMLVNAEKFLRKMEYVFSCFEGRSDACILWRPHPLLESTFDSMRQGYKPYYEDIKRRFIESGIGILDETADVEKSIAWSDMYIGDQGTSVISLFGVVGKPIFILNNNINTEPGEDDWRGKIIKGFFTDGNDDWMITQGNKLYHAPNHDYNYKYYCDLSEYASGDYYLRVIEKNGKEYVCPANAQDMLIIEDKKVVKKIAFERYMEQIKAFGYAWEIEDYIFLIPFRYPAIIRYDTKNDKVDYIKGYTDIHTQNVNGEWRMGGSCIWKRYLLYGSPNSNQIIQIDVCTLQVKVMQISQTELSYGGSRVLVPEGEDVWILPYTGTTVIKWSPGTNEVRIYANIPKQFQCVNRRLDIPCMDKPFGMMACEEKYIILSPTWGNMFVKLDKETGTMEEWKPLMEMKTEERNGYLLTYSRGSFIKKTMREGIHRYFYTLERKLYDVDLDTGSFEEISINFDYEELREHETGFATQSEWMGYACYENAFHSIKNLLDNDSFVKQFNKEKQLESYREIASNCDGTCGEKIHHRIVQK